MNERRGRRKQEKKGTKEDKMEEIRRRKGKKISYSSWRSVEQSGRREDKPNIDREEDLYCCSKKKRINIKINKNY